MRRMQAARLRIRQGALSRLMAVTLAVAVALVFVPCCDLLAAVTGSDAGAVAADGSSGLLPNSDGSMHDHAPAKDSSCLTALDEISNTLANLAPPAPNLESFAWLDRSNAILPLQFPSTRQRVRVRHAALDGPPIYLRFAHLLI